MEVDIDEEFQPNDRNNVTIKDPSNSNTFIVKNKGTLIYYVDNLLKKDNKKEQKEENIINNNDAIIFVGEPVLDTMIIKDENIEEFVPGGQALSQAIAYKKANANERVVFIGNFGGDENNNLDEVGKIIKDSLENLGIEVIPVISKNKKTRGNYVVQDEYGRTIFNPVKYEERPVITKEDGIEISKEITDKYNIKAIGIDGSLENIILPLICLNDEATIELDAGRNTKEERKIVKNIHDMKPHNLHIISSKSYANTLLIELLKNPKIQIIEDSKYIENNKRLVRLLQETYYPNSTFGVTLGSIGSIYVNDGVTNFIPSYKPENRKSNTFKDNSAGDTFHALYLSAITKDIPVNNSYKYATIGTSIAGYGEESSAKMNVIPHDKIIEELNKQCIPITPNKQKVYSNKTA